MPDENLLKFIRDGLAQGRTEDILRSLLISNGWKEEDIDGAFAFVKSGGAAAPTVNVTPPPAIQEPMPAAKPDAALSESIVSQTMQSPFVPERTPNIKLIAGAIFVLMLLIGGGAFAAYQWMGSAPSSQQVMDEMFKKGFAGVNAMDNTTNLLVDLHVMPATSTAAAGVNAYASAVFGGTPSELLIQFNSSGTILFASGTESGADQYVVISLSTKGEGQSVTLEAKGEFKMVDGVEYVNISEIPNFGFFNAAPFEGKWIALRVGSSTPGIAGVTTTVSAADMQKILDAVEGMIVVTKTLPNETIGGVSDYHYQYDISKTGVENAAVTFVTIAQKSMNSASTTLDASTTKDVKQAADTLVDAFTNIGGELWIGKSDYFPHQLSLGLAFTTSTAFGAFKGTINVTSTNSDLNGGQVVEQPSGAVDILTLMQSAFSSSSQADAPFGAALGQSQIQGRDARRVSDLHEIQNGLELYYNECGRYPGSAAPSGTCPAATARVSTFAGLSKALIGSRLGIYTVPNDPSAGATYYYGTDSTGQNYIVAAKLEDPKSSVFSNYAPPSLSGISAAGLVSCKAPMYCLTL